MHSPYLLPLWLLRYQVGSPEQPFMHRAIIRLHGHVRDPEIPVYGAKVLLYVRDFLNCMVNAATDLDSLGTDSPTE